MCPGFILRYTSFLQPFCAATQILLLVLLPLQKPWQPATDTAPPERALKIVTFQESVSVIHDGPEDMELESQRIQSDCVSSTAGVMVESPDSEVVQVQGSALFYALSSFCFPSPLFPSGSMNI